MKEINEAYETITKQRSGGGGAISVRPADTAGRAMAADTSTVINRAAPPTLPTPASGT